MILMKRGWKKITSDWWTHTGSLDEAQVWIRGRSKFGYVVMFKSLIAPEKRISQAFKRKEDARKFASKWMRTMR
jgi:hypothetical protein